MEIKNYKKLRGNLYEITMDNGKVHKLYDDIILKYELLIDKNIDSKKLEIILEENAELEAYYKAIKYIGLKMRTEVEIRKYLKKYDIPHKAIEKTIKKLKKDGYLDQRKYVEAYVNDALNLSLVGPQKIKSNLEKLGIEEEIIDEFLEPVASEVWRSRVERVIFKKSKTNKVGLALFKSKVYSELSFLGYYAEDIRSVLENFTLDTSAVFEKEAAKVYNRLASKYDGVELKLAFKKAMHSKGFDFVTVEDYLNRR